MNALQRYLPAAAVAVLALYYAGSLARAPKNADGYDFAAFGRLAVVEGGRVKPLDSVARVTLRVLSGREEFEDENGDKQPAIKWLADTMVAGTAEEKGRAWKYRVFRLDNAGTLALLGLERREGLRYSLDEIAPKFDKLNQRAMEAQKKPPTLRDLEDTKVLETRRKLETFLELAQGLSPLTVPVDPENEVWKSYRDVASEARRAAALEIFAREKVDINSFRDLPEEKQRALLAEMEQAMERRAVELPVPAAAKWGAVLRAYKARDPQRFNEAVADYRDAVAALPGMHGTDTAALEAAFNRLSPFYYVSAFYVAAFVLGLGYLLATIAESAWAGPLRKAAYWVTFATFLIHAAALAVRMVIHGRPPVTNLYSSAIFIGLGCVCLGLVLESTFRVGIGTLVGTFLGFATSVIAHNLGAGGDTLEMMQAVLDTNFWLATHVVVVTLGYVATLVAAAIAVFYILLGLLTPLVTAELNRRFGQMMYGTVCFAVLLSFVGTVLGGIWADQSWGRFWGWDPKENGAVLIVIWNALILHARWSGLAKVRGLAVLSVAGAMVTMWSWFGTNQLQVGLHSYGFSSDLALVCRYTWLALLAVIAVGLVPQRLWASFRTQPPTPGGLPRRR